MKSKMFGVAGLLGICLFGSVNGPVVAGGLDQPLQGGSVGQPALECSVNPFILGDGVNQPVQAATYPFCSTTLCATANPSSLCTCPPGTEAYKRVGPNAYTECDNYTWRAGCNYL